MDIQYIGKARLIYDDLVTGKVTIFELDAQYTQDKLYCYDDGILKYRSKNDLYSKYKIVPKQFYKIIE